MAFLKRCVSCLESYDSSARIVHLLLEEQFQPGSLRENAACGRQRAQRASIAKANAVAETLPAARLTPPRDVHGRPLALLALPLLRVLPGPA